MLLKSGQEVGPRILPTALLASAVTRPGGQRAKPIRSGSPVTLLETGAWRTSHADLEGGSIGDSGLVMTIRRFQSGPAESHSGPAEGTATVRDCVNAVSTQLKE